MYQESGRKRLSAKGPGLAALILVAGLAAGCDREPVSVEKASALCLERARKAASPSARLGIGADSDGHLSTSIGIGLSFDYLRRRAPDEVYDECVLERSGELPPKPYSETVGAE